MGAKYTTIASSGYNSSPPPDDGTQAAANLITWDKHKTKLSDPVKTLADSINTALVSAFDYSVRQISASDPTVASDHMRCVEIAPTVTTAVTVSLGDAATMTTVYRVFVKNSSAINQTVGRVTVGDTIDGTAANVTLAPGEGRIFQTNSTPNGYLTNSRFGPLVDTNPVAVGSSDGTKKVRLEVDGLTTATTRVLTAPDADIKLAGHATGLTANRVPYASGATGGVLTDSANLTFDGSTLAAVAEVTVTTTGSGKSILITDTGGNGANLRLIGDGGVTPNKTIRSKSGFLEFINSAYSAAVAYISDAGVGTFTGGVAANFTSAETAVGAASTTTTIAHGLGAVPSHFEVILRNKTTEFGYAVGDEVQVCSSLTANTMTVWADATNVGITLSGTAINVPNRSTFVAANITVGNWKYVVRAWK